MKFVAVAALFCLVASVACEDCNANVADCVGTRCNSDAGQELHCVDGICTCITMTQHECVMSADCHNYQGHTCNSWHCVDNRCRCFNQGGNQDGK